MGNGSSQALKIKSFWGSMPPDRPSLSRLRRSFSLCFLCVPRRKNHAMPLELCRADVWSSLLADCFVIEHSNLWSSIMFDYRNQAMINQRNVWKFWRCRRQSSQPLETFLSSVFYWLLFLKSIKMKTWKDTKNGTCYWCRQERIIPGKKSPCPMIITWNLFLVSWPMT